MYDHCEVYVGFFGHCVRVPAEAVGLGFGISPLVMLVWYLIA